MRIDRDFNVLCSAASHNEFAADAMSLMHSLSRRFWYIHYRQAADMPLTAKLHADIARAIADGDEARAAKASDKLLDAIEKFTRATVESRRRPSSPTTARRQTMRQQPQKDPEGASAPPASSAAQPLLELPGVRAEPAAARSASSRPRRASPAPSASAACAARSTRSTRINAGGGIAGRKVELIDRGGDQPEGLDRAPEQAGAAGQGRLRAGHRLLRREPRDGRGRRGDEGADRSSGTARRRTA